MITIASVLFKNRTYFEINRDLTQQLNPDTPHQWLLADNELGANFSLQEPDFFVLRPRWIVDTIEHMQRHQLHFLGSVWHPRWYYQYRYFPTVHFMLFDLQKVERDSLDLLPRIEHHRVWHFVNHPRPLLPDFVRLPLKIGRIRDTGYQIFRRYVRDPSVRYETFLPSYSPAPTFATWMESRLAPLVGDRWCFVPQQPGAFTSNSFLREKHLQAYWSGWEEFFWKEEPFAFHLRSVGRRTEKHRF